MLDNLAFRTEGRDIKVYVDDAPLSEVLGYRDMYGLANDEWRITARTLQGWMPQDLGLERQEYESVGEPIPLRSGWSSYPVRPLSRVLVTLPGGDNPEVPAEDVTSLVAYDLVPLLSCECGSGVGCAHESVTVTFERTRVRWQHGRIRLTFPRHAYDRAIRYLLALLGEAPYLITDEEWAAPQRTRVVHLDE